MQHDSFRVRDSINPTEATPLAPKVPGRAKWRAAFSEFVGTCIFVYLAAMLQSSMCKYGGDSSTVVHAISSAIGRGFSLCVVVFALGKISGGHVNPAVTFGAILTNNVDVVNGILYMIAQILGGIAGAALTLASISNSVDKKNGYLGTFSLTSGVSTGQGILIEAMLGLIITFAYASVKFNPPRTYGEEIQRDGADSPPLAVGFSLVAAVMASALLTGGCANPALALGTSIIANHWTHSYIFVAAPIVGGGIGALLWELGLGPDAFPRQF